MSLSPKNDLLRLEPEEQLILHALRWVVHPTESKPAFALGSLSSINESKFLNLATHHQILAFVAYTAQSTETLEAFPLKLREALIASLQNAQFSLAQKKVELMKVARLFAKENILIIPVKGIALASTLYKPFPYRLMSDLDLVVQPRDMEKTWDLLTSYGFKPEFISSKLWHAEIQQKVARQIGLDWIFYPGGRRGFTNPNRLKIDIHVRPTYGVENNRITLEPEFFWNKSGLKLGEENNVFLLAELKQMIFITLHTMDGYSPKLYQLLDLALLRKKTLGEQSALEQIMGGFPDSAKKHIMSFLKMVDLFLEPTTDQNNLESEQSRFLSFFLRPTQKLTSERPPFPPFTYPHSSYVKTVLSFLETPSDKARFILGYFIPNLASSKEPHPLRQILRHFISLVLNTPSFVCRNFFYRK